MQRALPTNSSAGRRLSQTQVARERCATAGNCASAKMLPIRCVCVWVVLSAFHLLHLISILLSAGQAQVAIFPSMAGKPERQVQVLAEAHSYSRPPYWVVSVGYIPMDSAWRRPHHDYFSPPAPQARREWDELSAHCPHPMGWGVGQLVH
jgi:hypothetical protein